MVSDNAYVGHDSEIGNNVYLNPTVSLNGCASIGDNTFVGTGAVVLPWKRIGIDCVVAASACVTRDVENGLRAGGVPAQCLDPLVSGNLAACNHKPYVSEGEILYEYKVNFP